MAKKEDMKKKSDQELSKLLVDVREAIRTERFAAAGARPKDSSAARKLRKQVARALTEKRTRELAK